MSTFGLNCRATAGYVTDGANQTYCLGGTGGTGTDIYPVTRGGLTFGWSTYADLDSRDRSTSGDVRLAGICFDPNYHASPQILRIDLPSTGTWNINAAFGDATAQQDCYVTLKDGGTGFKTFHVFTAAANNFLDANGTEWSAANWVTSNTALSHTFTSTTFTIEIGDPAVSGSGNTAIAHVNISSAGGGATYGRPYYNRLLGGGINL